MQTVNITKQFEVVVRSLAAAGKSPWFIVNEGKVVFVCGGRAAAREAKSVGRLPGTIMNQQQVKFATTDEAPASVAQVFADKVNAGASIGDALDATIAAVKAATPKTPKIPLVRESSIERPCKRVWHIADAMKDEAGGLDKLRRKDVLARCVADGIAFYTARTQYQLWLTIQNGGTI